MHTRDQGTVFTSARVYVRKVAGKGSRFKRAFCSCILEFKQIRYALPFVQPPSKTGSLITMSNSGAPLPSSIDEPLVELLPNRGKTTLDWLLCKGLLQIQTGASLEDQHHGSQRTPQGVYIDHTETKSFGPKWRQGHVSNEQYRVCTLFRGPSN